MPSTSTTELVPTTLPGAGARMMCVTTDGVNNGPNQVTGPVGSGSVFGIGSAWLHVTSGVVGIGTGNHGNTSVDVQTTTTGAWEFLQAPNGQSEDRQYKLDFRQTAENLGYVN